MLRPFDIGWTGDRPGEGRAEKLVERVRSLEPERAAHELSRIMGEFHGRHWRTELVFDERFAVAAQEMGLDADTMPVTVRRLVGAYFCNEYSYAAAAVTNPSIAPHPDQSGLSPGCVRLHPVAAHGWRRAYQLDRLSRGHRRGRWLVRSVAGGRFRDHRGAGGAGWRDDDGAAPARKHAVADCAVPGDRPAGGRAGRSAPAPLRTFGSRLRMDRHLHRLFGRHDPQRAAAHARLSALHHGADPRRAGAQQGPGAVPPLHRRPGSPRSAGRTG